MCKVVFWDDPWWWRQYAPLKRRSTIILHGSISQKTTLHIILAAVRTWNLTSYNAVHLIQRQYNTAVNVQNMAVESSISVSKRAIKFNKKRSQQQERRENLVRQNSQFEPRLPHLEPWLRSFLVLLSAYILFRWYLFELRRDYFFVILSLCNNSFDDK
jgi:hypothetical protein